MTTAEMKKRGYTCSWESWGNVMSRPLEGYVVRDPSGKRVTLAASTYSSAAHAWREAQDLTKTRSNPKRKNPAGSYRLQCPKVFKNPDEAVAAAQKLADKTGQQVMVVPDKAAPKANQRKHRNPRSGGWSHAGYRSIPMNRQDSLWNPEGTRVMGNVLRTAEGYEADGRRRNLNDAPVDLGVHSTLAKARAAVEAYAKKHNYELSYSSDFPEQAAPKANPCRSTRANPSSVRYQVAEGPDASTWSTHRTLKAARNSAAKLRAKGYSSVSIWKLTTKDIAEGRLGTRVL